MRKVIRRCIMLVAVMFLSCMVTRSWADFTSGDIYKDFTFTTTPGSYLAPGWDKNVPTVSVNVPSVDIAGATKAEIYISHWGGHAGTSGDFSVNGGALSPIPQPIGTPTSVYNYYRMLYATLPAVIPLSGSGALQTNNNIVIRVDPNSSFWPMLWLYSVTVRVYYGNSKPHPTGTISVVPSSDNQTFTATATPPTGKTIKQVDYIGNYKDFNWEGDGRFQNWHHTYINGILKNHIGTATSGSYSVTWDTRWIPDQDQQMKVVARIVDSDGYCYITNAVNPTLSRNYSVKLYSSNDVPQYFGARNEGSVINTVYPKYCHYNIETMTNATAAKLIINTWAGAGQCYNADDCDATVRELGINGTVIAGKPGTSLPIGVTLGANTGGYAFNTYDIPGFNTILKGGAGDAGKNEFFVRCNTWHHALEVNWPGPVILVSFGNPGTKVHDVNSATGISTVPDIALILGKNGLIRVNGQGVSSGRITLSDLAGRKVSLIKIGEGLYKAGRRLQTGIYVAKIMADDGKILTGKVFKD